MDKQICPNCLEVIPRKVRWGNENYDYSEYVDIARKAQTENESLRELLAANVRVIKEELRKEMAKEND